ncbi:organic cation transporter protein-like isoform X3 [Dermacentor variabilis]|uniref:organic cation transporter protein-like isoform X3 n=1 Tax=Dermacentor variabilis TaxID=34621 RepID=UPI003F5B024F
MSTIDDILLHLGPWHYPVLVFCFFRGFPAAYYAMSLSFTAPSLRHWCARPPQLANWTTERWLLEAVPPTHVNEKTMPSQCDTYSIEVLVNGTVSILNDSTVRCSSWEYDLGDNTNTMTNDFNLVCDRVWLRAASQSFYMAGIMIGNFIFSHMSDWYGRKRALVFMTPLPLLASVVMCLSTSFLMLNVGRLVASLGLGGILNTTYTMSMEVLSARHRALGSLISTGGWTTGLLTMTGLAWLFRDWMLFQAVITIAALGSVVNWLTSCPQSPRSRIFSGQEAYELRRVSCLPSPAEYPGRLLGVVAVNYFRRRTAYIGLYVFASICSAVAIFVPADASWALMASALLAKMGLIAAHCVNVVQMSELYPTRLRTTAMGFTITTSRVGAILAPFTKELGVVFFPWVPKVVDITVCACLILVSLPLPETFKEPLPDTLHDIKKAKKSRKGKDPVDSYVAAEAQPLR